MADERGETWLYPNRRRGSDGEEGDGDEGNHGEEGDGDSGGRPVTRRRLLAGSATAGAALTAGCAGGSGDATTTAPGGAGGAGDPVEGPTVFVFNSGDGTVSLVDADADEVVRTRHVDLTATFPSNQWAPDLTTDAGDPLWCNVGRGVRALAAGSLSELARRETGSGANWQEVTPDGSHLVVSAREPSHTNYRIDADPDSSSFGEVTGELDRTGEGGRGDREGPGPCDVTIHPDGRYAYVPDLFGDTLTVLDVENFEIATQRAVDPVAGDAAKPWMGTAAWDGAHLVVEHDEGGGTESIWDTSDPAAPELVARLTREDGLGGGPLTSEVGPDSETAYVLTPGTGDVTVVDIPGQRVRERIDLGGQAFAATWGPAREKLYVPIQTADEVAVLDHAAGELVSRLSVGANPYGATAARVRPAVDGRPDVRAALAQLGVESSPADTSYCIGNCACGHELDEA